MSEEPTVIRASALSSYADCSRRGAARMFWREIEAAGFRLRRTPHSIGAIVGTAVHRAAEVILAEKAHSGVLPPTSIATDAALDELHEQLGHDREIEWDSATINRNDAVRQSVQMSKIYHLTVAPQIEPILVEERLEAGIGANLILTGRPDLICREPRKIRDLKTGARLPTSAAPQLGAYALLSRSNGLDIDEASIDFIQRVAPKKPQPDPISRSVSVARAETAATNIIRHIAADLTTFRQGDLTNGISPGDPWSFIANPSSVLCSAKWCPAHSTDFCREWRTNE